jgi:hypothetical protein
MQILFSNTADAGYDGDGSSGIFTVDFSDFIDAQSIFGRFEGKIRLFF